MDSSLEQLTLTEQEFWARYLQDEGVELEFKESMRKAAKLQDPFVAFANTRGGTLVVGVTEGRPRKIIGVQSSQAFEERVQEIARITHPPLTLRTRSVDVAGRAVALIEVDRVEEGWVQTSDGRLLVRAGPTNKILVGSELQRFVQERGSEPAEDRIIRSATVDDLDLSEVRHFLRVRLGKRKVQVPSAFRDLGFTDQNGRLRLSTLLLFGRNPQAANRRFGIDILRFEGPLGSRIILRDRQQLRGNLPALIAEADRTIYREMRRDAVIRGLVREEIPEFPPVAIREALVNAVGHRDYSLRGASVEVRLFDDGIEIESPGTLAGYVTVDNLRDAQYSRNERIMDAFHDLGLVEEAGTGIDRMYAEMENALLDPPDFDEFGTSFRVRFKGGSVFTAEDRLWISRFAGLRLSAQAKVALVFARRSGSVSNEQLRTLRSLSSGESRSVLQDLVTRGLLSATGRGRGTRYVLSDVALKEPLQASVDEQLPAIVAHARRSGEIANRDVRGLLNVDSVTARTLLELAVARGFLEPIGERRGRRYLPREAGGPARGV